jgi:hypothetical protein
MVCFFLGGGFFFDKDDEALGSGVFLKVPLANHHGDAGSWEGKSGLIWGDGGGLNALYCPRLHLLKRGRAWLLGFDANDKTFISMQPRIAQGTIY